MYTEIEIIQSIQDKQARVSLYTDFLEEYAGWLQHLRSVGSAWGAGGEPVGAAKEAVKAKQHIALLKKNLMAEFYSPLS